MITEKEMRRMALLSKLSIADSEMPHFIKGMEDLLEHIKAVESLGDDSDDVLREVEEFKNLREDRVEESVDREGLLKNSEGASEGFVRLRKRA